MFIRSVCLNCVVVFHIVVLSSKSCCFVSSQRLRFLKSEKSGHSMKVLFQGIPTGLQLAKEFKGSTTKKIDKHRESSSGDFFHVFEDAWSKVQVTFHGSGVQVKAPSINCQTTQISLDL